MLALGVGCSVLHNRKGREGKIIPGGYSLPAKGPAREDLVNHAAAHPIVAARKERRERGTIKRNRGGP